MLRIRSLREGLPVFKALDSETWITILEMLRSHGPMSISTIAQKMGVTAGALTPHIRMLQECRMLTVEMVEGRHGTQKICRCAEDGILVETERVVFEDSYYETDVEVGRYVACDIHPTCGICTHEGVIGLIDDPDSFHSPRCADAGILWFTSGYVEYAVPCFLKAGQEVKEIQISMEISSEAPGIAEDWPSDIFFCLNGKLMGTWTSPGDFGPSKGIYNPSWWYPEWNQYGLYKALTLNANGTYMDGVKIGETRLEDVNIAPGKPMMLRIGVKEDAKHVGGVTIFGSSFGNYPQSIRIRVSTA